MGPAGPAGSGAPLVTTLPTNPVDGDQVLFLADATAGLVWPLRFRAGSASAYKWEAIGGPGLFHYVGVSPETIGGTANLWRDLATYGPVLAAPLAGDYFVEYSLEMETPAGTDINAQAAPAIGGAVASADRAIFVQSSSNVNRSGAAVKVRKDGLTAGQEIRLRYNSNTTTARFQYRRLVLTPIRVG